MKYEFGPSFGPFRTRAEFVWAEYPIGGSELPPYPQERKKFDLNVF